MTETHMHINCLELLAAMLVENVLQKKKKTFHPNRDRQLHGTELHKKLQRNSIFGAELTSQGFQAMVPGKEHNATCLSPPRMVHKKFEVMKNRTD